MHKILFNLLVTSVFLGTIQEASAGKTLQIVDKSDWKKSPKASFPQYDMYNKGFVPSTPIKKKLPLFKSLVNNEYFLVGSDQTLWRKTSLSTAETPLQRFKSSNKETLKFTIEKGSITPLGNTTASTSISSSKDFRKVKLQSRSPQAVSQDLPKIIVTFEG